jgi:DNA repair exonuclease SbcCD ATPase subunit
MKIKKIFAYEGISLKIVEREEPYLNSTMTATRVIAPNGQALPINFRHKQTLKSMQAETLEMLEGFKKRGADVVKKLTENNMTKEQLIIEVQELKDALKESDSEVKELDEKLRIAKSEADKRIEELESEIEDLERLVPTIKTLEDDIKHDLFVDNFNKIRLVDFENFINALELY